MIKLYTSYYANMKNIPTNYLMVGISQYCPEWLKEDAPDNFMWVKGNFLAPDKELLDDIKSGRIDHKTYTERYTNKFYESFDKSYVYKSVDDWYQAMDKEFSDKLWKSANKISKNTDIKIHSGYTFSVDTIFSQYAHIEEFTQMGCNTIEMETATLFHTSNIVNIKSSAIMNISDNTVLNKSLYSGRTDEEQQRRYKVKKDIIPRIALDVLLK